jgi:glyoxylase-like metal-dependent hydrolase (beta-lactamase superfamily II)
MQRLSFGSITVDALSDGELRLPIGGMFPGADPAPFRALGGVDEDGNVVAPLTTFVIRTAGRLLLVDTGLGPELGSLARFGFDGKVGLLPGALATAGIDPAAVNTVVFTHLHSDHIGWNVTGADGELRPLFPNAEYVVSQPEWAHWSATQSKEIARCVRTIEAAGQLRTVEDGFEPAPGVRMLLTPGHTPGHACVLVTGGGDGGVITGDAAHHPAEMELPEIRAGFDTDPEQSCKSRAALVARIEAEGLTVMGGHFPPPGAGNLVRVGARRTWRWLGA